VSNDRLAGQVRSRISGNRWLRLCRTKVPMGVIRSGQRQYQSFAPPRPRLSRHELSTVEGAALGATKTEFVVLQKAA
jgi:hypothetical protein